MSWKNYSRQLELAAQENEKEKEYWFKQLSGVVSSMGFMGEYGDIMGSDLSGYGAVESEFTVTPECYQVLNTLSNHSPYTLHIILVAAIGVLLQAYTGQGDIVIGTPIYRHETEEGEEGELINTALAIRFLVKRDMTFKEVLLEVKRTVLEGVEHQVYPLSLLAGQLNLPETGDYFPLFDVAVLLENIHERNYIENFQPGMLFCFHDRGTSLGGVIRFDVRRYPQEVVNRVKDHFFSLLDCLVAGLNVKLSEVALLDENERKELLEELNGGASDYPSWLPIQGVFEQQVLATPDRVAVVGASVLSGAMKGELCLTYGELNERASILAYRLKELGLERGEIVGMMTERSVETVIGILAILKAGGGYMPISPASPVSRKRYLLRDAALEILLVSHEDGREETEGLDQTNIKTVLALDDPAVFSGVALENYCQGEINKGNDHCRDLAYIMYTSGSTGTPKGVMVEHVNVVRLVKNTGFVNLNEENRLLQTGTFEFDASTFEIWGMLLNGGGLFLAPKESILSPGLLKEILWRFRIDMMWMTSPLFNQLFQEDKEIFSRLQTLLVGGDVLSPIHINKLRSCYPGIEVINGYGPTENTTFSVTYRIEREYERNIPIGRPITHSAVYILGRDRQLLPRGIPGELTVGGDGVARGYLDNQELTAEKFITNPFIPGDRLYLTGDIARWLNDGNIEFLGRKDQQVKIRGFRVELEEIEKRLLQHPQVKEAVVITRKDENNEKYICAYVTPISGDIDYISYLSGELPDFMVPSYVIPLEMIPLTANGKVDKKALPAPGQIGTGKRCVPPRDELEWKLAGIWQEVLGIAQEKISIDDHFFKSGGHSLKAVRMISSVHKVFDVLVPLEEIFQLAVFGKLADFIRQASPRAFQSIPLVEERNYYPVSPAQRRIFILDQMEEQGIVYNIPAIWEWQGTLEPGRLERAFMRMIERHESFRTSFCVVGDEPVQKIDEQVNFSLLVYHVSQLEDVPKEIGSFVQPFQLSRAPLIRAGVITLPGESHFLMVDMHHIIADGISLEIFQRELMAIYQEKVLPVLPLRYRDFACWQVERFQGSLMDMHKEFWLNMFPGELPILELPYDFTRPTVQSFAGNIWGFSLPEAVANRLRELASQEGVTLFILVFSLFYGWLMRLSSSEDIVVGTPVSGRNHADLGNIIGMFVNTLAIRCFPGYKKTCREFLHEVKEQTLAAFSHQDYPFEDLVEQRVEHRDTSRNPLFDVMFTMKTVENTGGVKPGSGSKGIRPEHTIAKFDLTLNAVETSTTLFFTFEYCTRLFKKETLERFSRYFTCLASNVGENPGMAMGEMEMMPGEEKERILFDFNRSETRYPRHQTIQELFEEQVENGPDRIALVVNEMGETSVLSGESGLLHLTYGELNRLVNRLAHLLRAKGVKPDDMVGLKIERSVKMMVGILGILKAGGAYLPVDPGFPQARVDFMLGDAATRILVTRGYLHQEKTSRLALTIVDLDGEEIMNQPDFNPGRVGKAEDLAYVIYTSGTTGNPKGTLTTHYNAVRIVRNTNFTCLSARDRMLQLSNYAFDGSIFDTYGALLNGGTLVMIERERLLVLESLAEWIERQQVTGFFITAALFNTLVDLKMSCFRHVTRILVGGEKLSVSHVKKALAYLGPGRLINGYGPTETTVFAAYYPIDEIPDQANSIPIGRPVGNTSIYILDRVLSPVPLGITGEIYVGGDGVARGYLNRPELTGEKFITYTWPGGNKEFFYKTGDLGRWQEDGNIEFFGRLDHQVKIRGFRIELGEIEARLTERKDIKEAVVLARTDAGGDSFLCAYLVPVQNDAFPAPSGLKEYLARSLPDYMIPVHFIIMEAMPLTTNGKIDRSRLPQPEMTISTVYEAPVNEIEKQLVDIWAGVLRIEKEKIGARDNFFDLGGQSLKATLLIARVHDRFGVRLLLTDVFTAPFIRELAERIQRMKPGHILKIEPVEKKEYYQMTSAQKRLFILNRIEEEGTNYNLPMVFRVMAGVSQEMMARCLQQLLERHEVLRTGFLMVDDKPVQRVYDQVDFTMEVRESAGNSEASVWEVVRSFVKPFQLAQVPLFRSMWLECGELGAVVIMDMHHIIADGISLQVFLRELAQLCVQQPLPGLQVQYKDYAEWQAREEMENKHGREGDYWLKQFAGDCPVLTLPYDFPRPAVQSFAGDREAFFIGLEETGALLQRARQEDITLFMMMLGALHILLFKLSGQEDIVIGTAVAGRGHAELQGVMGMFVNTLALRQFPSKNKQVQTFLQEIKTVTLGAFENQEYPFEKLVERVAVNRDVGRNPVFDVMIAYLPFEKKQIAEVREVLSTFRNYENLTSKFDLTLQMSEIESVDNQGVEGKCLLGNLEYCTALFRGETVQRFVGYFQKILRVMAREPGMRLGEIDILPEAEKQQLLETFNDTDFDGYPLEWTLIDLFENQVEKTRYNRAVIMKGIFAEGSELGLTYWEFSQKVGAMASHLQALGVKAETVVGVMVERSLEMMLALYGILKIGAAYLPIEPGYPAHRVLYLLKDSQASALVTTRKWQKVLEEEVRIEESLPLVFIDEVESVERESTGRFSSSLPAYVIYTSGSTGKPKGVMVEHCSVVNRISWMVRQYPLQENDVVLQKTTYTFDVSIWELFSWSFTGATLCLLEPGGEKNPPLLAETMERAGVTTMHFVPSMLNVFLDYMEDAGEKWHFDRLRQVFTSGEALGVHHVQRFNRLFNNNRVIQLINLYGPTEATVDVSYFDCPEGEAIDLPSIPIGKPIDNIRLFVLDRELQLLPVGVVGELCIAGIGVARGYLNRPGLTMEKFIQLDHLLSQRLGLATPGEDHMVRNSSLYRTGDLARWLSDGNIEYLGRLDHQVKIRGFRIELGEIEALLSKYVGVKEVVVIDRRDEVSDAYLCAYIVPSMPGFDASGHGLALREYLLTYLPEYMIPAFFVTLESLPLTGSGKLNRVALPQPKQLDLGTGDDYIEPRTALEKIIADTWKEVLKVEKIGIHDMFFTIGGNSLNILQVNRRLVQKLGKAIPVVTMFRFTTISRLAAHLSEDETGEIKNQEGMADRAETRSKGKDRRIMKIKKRREKSTTK